MIEQLTAIEEQIREAIGDPGPMVETFFNNSGVCAVYNFDALTLQQVSSATAVLEYEEALEKHPPKTLHDIERSNKSELFLKSLSFLLLFDRDGDTTPFTVSSARDMFEFLQSLPASELQRLQRCRNHFFIKTGRPVRALVEQLKDTASVISLMSSAQGAVATTTQASSHSIESEQKSDNAENSTEE